MREAMVESVVNLAVGFVLSVVAAYFLVPLLFDFEWRSLWLGLSFSLISLLRSFCLRLLFRWIYGA